MERRTQILIGGLVGVILLWQGWLMFNSTFMQPLWKSRTDLEELQKNVSQKNKEMVVLADDRIVAHPGSFEVRIVGPLLRDEFELFDDRHLVR